MGTAGGVRSVEYKQRGTVVQRHLPAPGGRNSKADPPSRDRILTMSKSRELRILTKSNPRRPTHQAEIQILTKSNPRRPPHQVLTKPKSRSSRNPTRADRLTKSSPSRNPNPHEMQPRPPGGGVAFREDPIRRVFDFVMPGFRGWRRVSAVLMCCAGVLR